MSSRSIGYFVALMSGIILLGAGFVVLKKTKRNPPHDDVAAVEPPPTIPHAVGQDVTPTIGPPKVKLAVLVVFDQMRGDYIDRSWSELCWRR